MKDITSKTESYYRYNGKFYTVSRRTDFRINDVFFDGRNYSIKIIETEEDLMNAVCIAPELYVILEEVTI
jgi:hypothetical protein